MAGSDESSDGRKASPITSFLAEAGTRQAEDGRAQTRKFVNGQGVCRAKGVRRCGCVRVGSCCVCVCVCVYVCMCVRAWDLLKKKNSHCGPVKALGARSPFRRPDVEEDLAQHSAEALALVRINPVHQLPPLV